MNGELPKGWIWTSLENIADIVLGQSPPSSTYNEDKIGLPFYQGKSEFGLIYPTPTKWCFSPKKIAESGDILISVRAPVGPTNICPEKSCIGRGLAAIRGLENINNKFILYLLRNFEEQLRNKATGTTFEAITGNVLRDFEVPLPPLQEQQRIVNKIEELFTNLDKGVESLEEVKYKLKVYRKAILKYAMEGKLTEKWREENKDKIEDFVGISGFVQINNKTLYKIPTSWRWVRLEEVAKIILGQSPPSSTYNEDKIGLPFYQGKTEFGQIYPIPVKWCSSPRKIAEKGDVLISVRAPVGPTNICPEKSCIGRGLAAIRGLKYMDNKFLLYLLRALENDISSHATGTTFEAIRGDILKNLAMPLPPLEEQNIIVERIEKLFSLADYIEETVDSKLEQSKTLRQSILKKAFEGKLVPQDPNDEPAEILLEKIKKQRLNKGKLFRRN